MVGVDVPSQQAIQIVRKHRLIPIFATLFTVIFLLTILRVIRWRDAQTSSTRLRWRQLETGVTVFLGLLFTAVVVWFVHLDLSRSRQEYFTTYTSKILESFRIQTHGIRERVISIARFIESSEEVSKDEFIRFADPMLSPSLLSSIAFTPIDPRTKEPIFRLSYVINADSLNCCNVPQSYSTRLQKAALEAIKASQSSGLSSSSNAFVRSRCSSGNEVATVIAYPVRVAGPDPIGYVIGILHFQTLLNSLVELHMDAPHPVVLSIHDLSGVPKEILAHFPLRFTIKDTIPLDTVFAQSNMDSGHPIFVFGRVWMIHAQPPSDTILSYWEMLFTALSGVILTLLVAAIIRRGINYQSDLENEVDARTKSALASLVRNRQQQAMIAELSNSSELINGDVQAFAQIVTVNATNICRADRTSIWMLDAAGEMICNLDTFTAHDKTHTQITSNDVHHIPNLIEYLRTNRFLHTTDPVHDDRVIELRDFYQSRKTKALLLNGVFVRGDIVGIISISRIHSDEPLNEDEITFGMRIADQFAIAVLNAKRNDTEEGLRRSEEKFRTIAEHIDDVLFVTDATGVITYISPSCSNLFLYVPNEVVQTHFSRYLTPESASIAAIEFQRIIMNGQGGNRFQLDMVRKGGSVFTGELSASAIFNQGVLSGTIGIIRDISERVQTEIQLKKRDDLLQASAEVTHLLITEADFNTAIEKSLPLLGTAASVDRVYVFRNRLGESFNSRFTSQIFEWTNGKVISEINNDNLQDLSYEDVDPMIYRCFLNREVYSGLVADLDANTQELLIAQGIQSLLLVPIYSGNLFWGFVGFDDCKSPRVWDENEISIMASTADSMGGTLHRNRVQEGLNRTYATLVKSQRIGKIGSFSMNFSSNRLEISETLHELIGLMPYESIEFSEVIGFIVEDKRAEVIGEFRKHILQHHDRLDFTCPILRRSDQANRWLNITAEVREDEHGQLLEMIGTAQDITEQKLVQNEIESLTEQLHMAMKMEALGRLAGGVAHDFNNILTSIIGNSDLASIREAMSLSPKEQLEEIKKAGDRAKELVKQLLAFSRKQANEPKVIQINDVITNTCKMLERTIGDTHTVQLQLSAELGNAYMDPNQFDQVLMNLAVNARDAMPNGGSITFITANQDLLEEYTTPYIRIPQGQYVTVSVVDTGMGMNDDIRKRVFDPFFTTKPSGKGTGLGLSTCFGIVMQAHGHIDIITAPDQGCTFKIYLPRIDLNFVKPEIMIRDLQLPRGNETVLLVEDDAELRVMVTELLATLGYRVFAEVDGFDALSRLQAEAGKIDLLFTDIIMPKMNGRELVQSVHQFYPKVPVLYTSGYPDEVITDHGLEAESIPLLRKPFGIEVLAKRVREALDRNK